MRKGEGLVEQTNGGGGSLAYYALQISLKPKSIVWGEESKTFIIIAYEQNPVLSHRSGTQSMNTSSYDQNDSGGVG